MIEVRAERPDDFDAISRVVAAAFGSEAEALLVERIRASPAYLPDLALVAVDEGDVLGHVMISLAGLMGEDGSERPIAMLSPLAVAPDRQRTGIGSALVRAVTALADERGEPVVVLQGSPAYYPRLGFEPSAPLGITMGLPDWAPPDAAQALRLRAYDPSIRGRLVEPAAFDGLE